MRYFRLFFCASILFCTAYGNTGASTKLEIIASRNNAQIGEILIVNISLVSPIEYNFSISPKFPEPIEIARQYPIDTIIGNGTRLIEMKYEITSFEKGVFVIPEITTTYEKPSHRDIFVLKSNSLTLEFFEPSVDTLLPPRDAYTELEIASNDWQKNSSKRSIFCYLIIVVNILIFIMIVCLGMRANYLYNLKNSNDFSSKVKWLLKQKKQKEISSAYSELSLILNDWLINLAGINTSDLESANLSSLLENKLSRENFIVISKAKRRIELVLFARKAPIEDEFIEDCQDLLAVYEKIVGKDGKHNI